MKQFFNLIPSEGCCCILLHGEIGQYDSVRSADIARELMEAERLYTKIDIRINSMGGEVYTGIAIFNALRNSKADVTIYIDGVAASMASVIALCGKPVYMSKYSRLMIHGVSGGCYGNRDEIQKYLEQMELLEQTICDMLSEKCGKTPEEIRQQFFDGKDHWLKAEEALAYGFIDGVYDADPVPEDSTPDQVYNVFKNRYEVSLKNSENMFEKLKNRPSFANCADEEAVLKRIDDLETDAAKVPDLEKKNQELQTEVDGFKEKENQAKETQIKDVLDKAQKEERFGAPQRGTFEALLRKDWENGLAAINALPAKRRAIEDLGGGGNQGEGKGAWEKRMEEIRNKTQQ